MKTPSNAWDNLEAATAWSGWWQSGDDELQPLPIHAARGKQDGPTLLITSGVHGDEYEGPAAIAQFFADLDLTTLRGRVIGIPVVNMAAWRARSRHTPSDGGDLNRNFAKETITSETTRLAQVVYETFIRPCDVLVDLHSGGGRLIHLPLIGWYHNGIEAERLARRFGTQLNPWLIPDVPGVLSYEAHRLGKVALGAEWRGGATLDPMGVAAYATGLQRLWGLVAGNGGDGEQPNMRPVIAGDYQVIEVGGLFTPWVALGDVVVEGAALGVVRDELGVIVATPLAFRGGTVAALPHFPLLAAQDRIAYIG